MAKLTLSPERDSYSIGAVDMLHEVPLEGGFSRARQKTTKPVYTINVAWKPRDPVAYNYLLNFYRTTTKHGALSFTMDLITDQAGLSEHECRFVNRSFTRGKLFAGQYMGCGATLQVIPIDPSAVTTEDGTEEWFNQHYYADTGQGASEMCDAIQSVINAL